MSLIFKMHENQTFHVFIPHFDLNQIEASLDAHLKKIPKNFYQAKALVAQFKTSEKPDTPWLKSFKDLCFKKNLLLIAVMHPDLKRDEVAACSLCLFQESDGRPCQNEALSFETQEKKALPVHQIIRRTIRSGQRIEAAGDVTIIGSVHSGAEVVAAGNIYILGVLRGRAFAGNQGNVQSFIFCQQMSAELLSIAGRYQHQEQLAWCGTMENCLITLNANHELSIERIHTNQTAKFHYLS